MYIYVLISVLGLDALYEIRRVHGPRVTLHFAPKAMQKELDQHSVISGRLRYYERELYIAQKARLGRTAHADCGVL